MTCRRRSGSHGFTAILGAVPDPAALWRCGAIVSRRGNAVVGRARYRTQRLTKASEMSQTSRQPLSMVSPWPRLGIVTVSVTPGLRDCFSKIALVMAGGTVLSFSPETISIGPRSGFRLSALASVHALRLAVAAWKIGVPDAGTANSA